MKMRPCRNRMSRFVAAEMRYFHRPFAMSVLSCCTSIIALVSALLSLLFYVGSSDDGAGSPIYLNLSIGLLIALIAAYIIYIIIKWGRLPSYSLVMSFTAVNYVVSAFGGFLLSRSVLYDMLEESIEGGFEYFLENILKWSFWAPAAILLFFFAASFVKSKTANHDGGWWYALFTFLPLSIILFVSFVMRMEIEKENFVTVTSISVTIYITIMLSIAARYIAKAVMNKFLSDMPVFEDAVVVKSAFRASDGKRIFWWEKKPPVSETDDAEKDADTAPASKPGAFSARFAAWFKRIFATSAPPDIKTPDGAGSDTASGKKTKKASKKDKTVPDGDKKSQSSEQKNRKEKQKAKTAETKAKTKNQKDTEQTAEAEQSDTGTQPIPTKQKAGKKKRRKAKSDISIETDTPKPLSAANTVDVASGNDVAEISDAPASVDAPASDVVPASDYSSDSSDVSNNDDSDIVDTPTNGGVTDNNDVSDGGDNADAEAILVPKSPKLAEILARLKSKNKDNKTPEKDTAESSETEFSAQNLEPLDKETETAGHSVDTSNVEEDKESVDEWFAENIEPNNEEHAASEAENSENANDEQLVGEFSEDNAASGKSADDANLDDEPDGEDSGNEIDEISEPEQKIEVAEPSDATTDENAKDTTEQETDVLLNRVVGALNVAIDNHEIQNSAGDVVDTEEEKSDIETDASNNGIDDEQQHEQTIDNAGEKNCGGCGAIIEDGSNLCPKCGL